MPEAIPLREIDTSSEEYRHICEIEYVLELPDRESRNEYLSGVAEKRGIKAANKLKSDAYDEWQRRKNGITENNK